MGSPRVRLLLNGEPVCEVTFQGAPLRIGRMKENDLVVNNLSVSRFHATLRHDVDGFLLKDLGSENGCWVNGERVAEGRVRPGDRIVVGKHQLEILLDEAGDAAPAEAAPRGRSDAWDAAATYFAGPETQARMVGAAEHPAPAPPKTVAIERELAPEPAEDAAELPFADDGAELFGGTPPGAELAAPDLAEFDVSELDLRDGEGVPAEEPLTAILEAEADGTELMGEAPAPADPEEPEEAPLAEAPLAVAAEMHAGLIVQRNGRLERVIRWDAERLTMGRATECDVLLATPEVSRRHAMLVREGDRFEVRDLESINGTFVNGEKVSRRALQVGDVVRVEDFEITFVLDSAPIDQALKAEPMAAPSAAPRDPGLTQIGEMMDLAPFVAEGDGEPAEAMSFDALPLVEALPEIPAPGEDEPVLEAEPDTVLLADEEPAEELDEEKDLVESPGEARVLRLDLRVRLEELPPALREALKDLDLADLRLPVELRLDPEEGSG
jgi:pSer/pThr/pTyr-binding forkhead associated (FHA) protein